MHYKDILHVDDDYLPSGMTIKPSLVKSANGLACVQFSVKNSAKTVVLNSQHVLAYMQNHLGNSGMFVGLVGPSCETYASLLDSGSQVKTISRSFYNDR